MNSPMMNAFIKQTYEPHGGYNSYEKKCEEVIRKADQIHGSYIDEARTLLAKPQEISNYFDVPTNIKSGELDSKTVSHPKFSNYDHSLEMDRLSKLREKYNYIEPSPQVIKDTKDTDLDTTSYENIEADPNINLNGIFDGIFGI